MDDEDNQMPKGVFHKLRRGLEYSRFRIDIPDLNILKWDFSKASFEELNHKNFLINLSLFYTSINYSNPFPKDSYYNVSKILINHLQAHLSPDDISLLYKTYNKQFEELWEDNQALLKSLDNIYAKMGYKNKKNTIGKKIQKEKNERKFSNENAKNSKIEEIDEIDEIEEINEYKQKISIQNAEILLLNELKETKRLSPFLKLIIKMDPFTIKSIVRSKKTMSCYIEIFLLFYNPFSNKTEPMIEKTPFKIEIAKNEQGITYLAVQLADDKKKTEKMPLKSPILNINISEEMLALFFKVKDSWIEKLVTNENLEKKKTFSENNENFEKKQIFLINENLEKKQLYFNHENFDKKQVFSSSQLLEKKKIFPSSNENLEKKQVFFNHENLEKKQLFLNNENFEKKQVFSNENLIKNSIYSSNENLEKKIQNFEKKQPGFSSNENFEKKIENFQKKQSLEKKQSFPKNISKLQINSLYPPKNLNFSSIPKELLPHHKKFISRKFSNSYTIKNDSGYDLRIRKHERKKLSISKLMKKKSTLDDTRNFLEVPNGQSSEYEIESAENDFEHNFCQPLKIYLEFKSFSKNFFYIQDVSLNRLRSQQIAWKSHNLTKDNLHNKFFLCNVKLKETKTKLTITSPINFINRTSKTVEITIISEEIAENLVFQVFPGKKKPIPIEYAENQSMFSLKFVGKNANFITKEKNMDFLPEKNFLQEKNFESRLFTFWSLKSSQGIKGFEGQQGDFFYILRSSKNLFVNKLDIYIESLFSITNCLPVALEIEFFTKNNKEKESNFVKLLGQETYLYTLSSINSAVFMRLQSKGLKKSDEILVFSGNMTKTLEKITMFSEETEEKSEKIQPVNIFMIFQANSVKVDKIFLYTKGCIINETKENLLFYSVNSSISKSKSLLPGQIDGNNVILFDETTQIVIGIVEGMEISNNISIKGVGEVKVAEILKAMERGRGEIKGSKKKVELMEFAVNISSKCSGFFIYFSLNFLFFYKMF